MRSQTDLVVNARFLSQSVTGVQRFAIEISKQLRQLDKSIRFIAPKNIINHELADLLGAEIIGNMVGHRWEQYDLPRYLKSTGSPLLINLANTAPIFYKWNFIVLHSLSFTKLSYNSLAFFVYYNLLIPIVAKRALGLFTVSDYTRKEILKFYSWLKLGPKLSTLYPGINHHSFYPERDMSNENGYILYVGALSKSKNVEKLVSAFAETSLSNVKLKIVGSTNRSLFKGGHIDVTKNIELLGHIDDVHMLRRLYSNAAVFVFPSLHESFGIPPLEAQACGCPTIISSLTSLPEIFGDSALYCNANSSDDIREKIESVVSNQVLANKLRDKGLKNVRRYSWQLSATKLLDYIRDSP